MTGRTAKYSLLWLGVLVPLVMAVTLVLISGLRVLGLRIPEAGAPFQTEVMRQRAEQSGYSNPFNVPWTPLEDMSAALVCAVVKAEDRSFFRHRGFDWSQLAKAARLALASNVAMGGSTITQQLARNLYLSQQRSWWRKIEEAVLTVWLEIWLGKDQILALYLNSIEWGRNVWGANAAAHGYFHIPPRELGLEQALFLASLIANPRTNVRSQLDRMSAVYSRVNHQLLFSGYYSVDRWQRANATWGSFASALQRGKPIYLALSAFNGTVGIEKLSAASAFRDGCGFDKETENMLQAQGGNPVSIADRDSVDPAR